tara:strand:- start:581 stop:757 length:177 start_codon:yes stop_codon:yes gene_type:complete
MQKTNLTIFSRSLSVFVSSPFHFAFAVTDIEATRAFYVEKLCCKVGLSAESLTHFDFF